MKQTARAYVALGSNMGERAAQVRQALGLLQAHGAIRLRQISRFFETEPVGIRENRDPQWFVNAVVGIDTEFTPEELLNVCLSIERRLGRKRGLEAPAELGVYTSRTMDIDILFYEDRVIDQPSLTVPHPRMHQRSFTLLPMLDIAPQWVHPVLQQTMQQLYQQLDHTQSEPGPTDQPALTAATV